MFAYCNNNSINYFDPEGNRLSEFSMCATHDYSLTHNPDEPYAELTSNGADVYIVASGDGKSMAEKYKDDRSYIIVEDKRASSDPNFKIFYSCYITEEKIQREVLQVIIMYDKQYPSDNSWTREEDEMLYEWNYHNYFAGIFSSSESLFDRFAHVDLNEADKGKSVWAKGKEFIWEKIG